METYNLEKFKQNDLPAEFAQDNHSRSSHGVLRGLHYQYPQWQGKLVRVIEGEIFDVAVDIRRDSASYGEWFGMYLNAKDHEQLYIPPGFAHGFCVVSDSAEVVYKCTTVYKPEDDAGIAWNDPDIGIEWPLQNPIVSEKDRNAPRLNELDIR